MIHTLRALMSLQLQSASNFLRYSFSLMVAILSVILFLTVQEHFGTVPLAIFYPSLFLVIAAAGFGPSVLVNAIFTLAALYFYSQSQFYLELAVFPYGKLMIFCSSSLLLSVLVRRNQLSQQQLIEREVLERRKIEETEERLTVAMQASRQSSWDIDLKTKSVSASLELWKFFGYSSLPPTLQHSDLLDRIIPEDRLRVTQVMSRALAEGTDYLNEYRVLWPDGSIHWITSRGRILRDGFGQPARMVGISFETTETKNLEMQLRQAKDDADHANRLKSAFLANMSHEIRTPLAALLGFTDLLRDHDLRQEERMRYLDIMARNGTQLSHVINDILDLSKVEAGQLRLEFCEFQPYKLAQEVLSSLSINAQEKGVRLELEVSDDAPRAAVSDPARLKQILLNIVGNAIKFTAEGLVQVTIRGRGQKSDGSFVVFEVRDTGIGIPENQRENIFRFFTQADNSMTRKYGGTGLGLPLSRRLAQIMGGDLRLLSSKPNQGTVFEISVRAEALEASVREEPLNPSSERTNFEKPEAEGSSSQFRLLVVEDSPDNRELIRIYLERDSFYAEFAENGAAAVSLAMKKAYDLILMDIQMPVLDGYEATRQLRQLGYDRPIVALTAHALSEFRKNGFKIGFTDYLTKPIRGAELMSVVRQYIRAPDIRAPKSPPLTTDRGSDVSKQGEMI